MIRGFYTAVSGLIANMSRQSVVADNIANVNTTGFRASRTEQSDFELELARSTGGRLGPLASAVVPNGPEFDATPGSIEQTGLPTDFAIEGDGLFAVRTASGVAYTRAGDFVLDATGTLTTQAGQPVLATDGQPIVANGGATGFAIGADGSIAGTARKLALVAWPAGSVVRLGGNLLGLAAGAPISPAVGRIRQGALEHSNVDLATEMTELVDFQRNLALNARSLRIADETLAEATQLGRLK
jgi:flagellar basal-body rod protein FlgG